MQTLYGQNVTDRLTINFDPAAMCYVGLFDDVEFTRRHTGQAVLREFQEWRAKLDAERKAEEAAKAQEAINEQAREDDKFLDELAYQLQTVSRVDLDKLIEVITRRINNGENS